MSKNKTQKGLTLMELLVVVAILGVLLSLAVPSISNTKQKSAVERSVSEIIGLMSQARVYSLSSGTSTSICIAQDLMTNDEISGAKIGVAPADETFKCIDDWTQAKSGSNNGWVVFKDANADGKFDEGSDSVLEKSLFDDYEGKTAIIARSIDVSAEKTIVFTRKGKLSQGSGVITIGSTTSDSDNYKKDINVNVTGRILKKNHG